MNENTTNRNTDFFCSECGKEVGKHFNICPHCGAMFNEPTEVDPGLIHVKKVSDFIKGDKKILGFLSAVFIFSLLASVFLIISSEGTDDKREFTEYIYSPVPGDIYEIKTDTDHFSLCKVIEAEGDTIYISFHTDESDTESRLDDLKTNDAFETETYLFTVSQLVERYNDGYILNIERKGEEPTGLISEETDSVKTIKPDASVSTGGKARPANR